MFAATLTPALSFAPELLPNPLVSQKLYDINWKQIMPRLGIAYRLSDTMGLRWNKEESGNGGRTWLQFRSMTYYHDRLKEVPNRLLARWAAARRAGTRLRVGFLTLDDLCEIAGLSDAQLDARDMQAGARELWGMAEWELPCNRGLRPHLRWMAGLSPD